MNHRFLLITLTGALLAGTATNVAGAAAPSYESPNSPSLLIPERAFTPSPKHSVQDRVVSTKRGAFFLRCVGTGSPTVILDDAGFVEAWMDVQPAIARFTRVCSYDRAGLGMSGNGPAQTSTGQLVLDLHALLRQGRVPGPYVLAGHALGGDTVRLYAGRYPKEVVGVVLVDALPPEAMRHGLVPNTDDVDFRTSRHQIESAGRLGSVPLMVLSHGVPYSYPADVERSWSREQRGFALLSSKHVFLVVPCGQNIPAVLPQVVVFSVRQLLRLVPEPSR